MLRKGRVSISKHVEVSTTALQQAQHLPMPLRESVRKLQGYLTESTWLPKHGLPLSTGAGRWVARIDGIGAFVRSTPMSCTIHCVFSTMEIIPRLEHWFREPLRIGSEREAKSHIAPRPQTVWSKETFLQTHRLVGLLGPVGASFITRALRRGRQEQFPRILRYLKRSHDD